MLLLVDDVDVVHALGIRLELAQAVDGISGGEGVKHGDVLGRHQSSGGVLAIGKQLFNVFGLVFLHLLQQLLRPFPRHVREQVGHLIRRHRLQDVGGPFDVEALQDRGLHVRLIDLLEGVGGLLVAQGGKDRAPVIRAELVDDVGDVGRVQLGELRVSDPQLDRAHVTAHRVNRFPGDQPLRPIQVDGGGDPAAEAFERDAPGQPAAADVNPHQQQRPLDLRELEVVDADHSPAIHVDDLLIEDLTRKPELVLDVGVRLQAGLVDLQAELLVVPAAHHRPIDGAHPAVPFEDHARDPRERLGHDDHEVADATDSVLSNVDDLSVEEIAEEDQYASSGIA